MLGYVGMEWHLRVVGKFARLSILLECPLTWMQTDFNACMDTDMFFDSITPFKTILHKDAFYNVCILSRKILFDNSNLRNC